MKRPRHTLSFVLLIVVMINVRLAGQGAFQQTEALIRQAREQGLSYLNNKDDRAKKAAKSNLD